MAASHSTLPPVHSRSNNGTPLYEKSCHVCGKISIVDKRKLGRPCIACANKARSTHGLAARGKLHPLYKLLISMRCRCEYKSGENSSYYYGRGISVCDEWAKDPAQFVAWAQANGWRPGLEIDRVDVDGDYCPDNCRFITHRENSQRTRRTSTAEQARAVKKSLSAGRSIKDSAEDAGVSYMVAWHIKNNPDVWSNV